MDFQWDLAGAGVEVIKTLAGKGIDPGRFKDLNYAAVYNLVREKEEVWGFAHNDLITLIDRVYDAYDLDAASRWSPVRDVHRLLGQLGEYKTALVSNIGRKGLHGCLYKFGLNNSFGLVVTRNDVNKLKPSGEGLLKALKWAGVNKEKTVHVGDSLSDIHAARDAGVKAAVVLGGENSPEILLREKPDIVLDNLSALPAALRSIGFPAC